MDGLVSNNNDNLIEIWNLNYIRSNKNYYFPKNSNIFHLQGALQMPLYS